MVMTVSMHCCTLAQDAGPELMWAAVRMASLQRESIDSTVSPLQPKRLPPGAAPACEGERCGALPLLCHLHAPCTWYASGTEYALPVQLIRVLHVYTQTTCVHARACVELWDSCCVGQACVRRQTWAACYAWAAAYGGRPLHACRASCPAAAHVTSRRALVTFLSCTAITPASHRLQRS